MLDQYQHPEEHRHTLAEVQGWFAENGIEYLRAYPSPTLCEDSEEWFTPAEDNWYLEGWLAQLRWIGCSSARAWPFCCRRSAHLTGGAVPQGIRLRPGFQDSSCISSSLPRRLERRRSGAA
jgi:hypothetical protein